MFFSGCSGRTFLLYTNDETPICFGRELLHSSAPPRDLRFHVNDGSLDLLIVRILDVLGHRTAEPFFVELENPPGVGVRTRKNRRETKRQERRQERRSRGSQGC